MSKQRKEASSQAAWALLTEGVTSSRLEAHRIQHMVNRVMELVQKSPYRDHLYQVAGDIITGLPQRLDALDVNLDRTSLALAKMGEGFLESRLPLSDKMKVEDALGPAFGKGQDRPSAMAQRVAQRWLQDNGE